MDSELLNGVDPREVDDRLDALEGQVERLYESGMRQAEFYREPIELAEGEARRARRGLGVMRGVTLLVLFVGVSGLAMALRANADLRWELFLEQSRSEALANHLGQLRSRFTQTRVELAEMRQLLIVRHGAEEDLALSRAGLGGDSRVEGLAGTIAASK